MNFKTNGSILESFPYEKFRPPRGLEEVVGSSPRGGRNFSHGKLSKIFICKFYFKKQFFLYKL